MRAMKEANKPTSKDVTKQVIMLARKEANKTTSKDVAETKSVARKKGSGRPKTGRTDQNIEDVEHLIQSQEGDEGSHSTQREIANCTGISKSTVGRIVIQDLKLKGYRKVKGQKLTPADKGKRVNRAKNCCVISLFRS